MKPAQNYKGLGSGPVGKRLASARMPKPTILRAGGGRVRPQPAYHPPHVAMRSTGKGSMGITPMGLLSRKLAMDRAETTQVIRGAKAGQGLDVAAEQLDAIERQMHALGIDLGTEAEPQGGL